MGVTGKIVVTTLIVAVVVLILIGVFVSKDHKIPDHFKDDYYWGPKPWKVGDPVPKDDPTINKFTINIDESVLIDLKSRLNNSRLPSSLQGSNFEYGFNCDYLKDIVNHWGTKYDWRKEEAALNKYPQFTTQIEGLTIHYYHIKPSVQAKVTKPLMLQHGWPGSVAEFQNMISYLTADSDLNFELIIPSLPGYGWSEASHKPGLSVVHIARILSKLMTRIGHDRFLFHSGSAGPGVGHIICNLFPDRIIGFHTTMPTIQYTMKVMVKIAFGSLCPSCVYDNPDVDYEKMYPVMKHVFKLIKESGFIHIQGTRPDTIGSGLNDSPAGLAAYILEKFAVWTNFSNIERPDGGLTDRFTLDQLLTNVMVYWVTGTITSSMRTYKDSMTFENMNEIGIHKLVIPDVVPVGVAMPGQTLTRIPRSLMANDYPNLISYKDYVSLGHFASFEAPDVIAKDIKSFVQAIDIYMTLKYINDQ